MDYLRVTCGLLAVYLRMALRLLAYTSFTAVGCRKKTHVLDVGGFGDWGDTRVPGGLLRYLRVLRIVFRGPYFMRVNHHLY